MGVATAERDTIRYQIIGDGGWRGLNEGGPNFYMKIVMPLISHTIRFP